MVLTKCLASVHKTESRSVPATTPYHRFVGSLDAFHDVEHALFPLPVEKASCMSKTEKNRRQTSKDASLIETVSWPSQGSAFQLLSGTSDGTCCAHGRTDRFASVSSGRVSHPLPTKAKRPMYLERRCFSFASTHTMKKVYLLVCYQTWVYSIDELDRGYENVKALDTRPASDLRDRTS